MLIGGVATVALSHFTTPMLVARRSAAGSLRGREILVASDGEEGSAPRRWSWQADSQRATAHGSPWSTPSARSRHEPAGHPGPGTRARAACAPDAGEPLVEPGKAVEVILNAAERERRRCPAGHRQPPAGRTARVRKRQPTSSARRTLLGAGHSPVANNERLGPRGSRSPGSPGQLSKIRTSRRGGRPIRDDRSRPRAVLNPKENDNVQERIVGVDGRPEGRDAIALAAHSEPRASLSLDRTCTWGQPGVGGFPELLEQELMPRV